ncbi:uncharacterized protein LOC131229435 isoform X1 [Magnolia sinica]|uniref:uncharacterized protein LOC131229435 isoform X1 n=1 Tax=Magnolia sinica TaxID=86752 RepID=UPI00265825B4|nr:uncharacterized protein LOC131229435 isoform X1 [Magnolia sinica]
MASIKTSSRYPSYDARSSTSSHPSDISSSTEFRPPTTTRRSPSDPMPTSQNSSRILARTKSADIIRAKNSQNFSSMVKKFMEKRSKPKSDRTGLIIPADFIAADLKKKGAKNSNLSSLPKKLFQKAVTGSASKKDWSGETKALTEVKSNTRTLAMVLRSERDLLSQNKVYEAEIQELRLMLEDKNREVEKLKDLCLNQREEIKALKNAILFPDAMNSQLHELLEKQGSELKQAKQVIPTLQKQVTSLTGQLQCLAEDLAEVKADKYATRACFEGHISSPRTPMYDQEASNSLEFSSGDPMTPGGSPDDMFLNDLNPCLTPCFSKMKSKECEEMMGDDSQHEDSSFGSITQVYRQEKCLSSNGGKMSKSSEYSQRPSLGSSGNATRAARKSDESKCSFRKPTHQKLFRF